MDRGAWRATVHGVTKSWTQLSESRAQQALVEGNSQLEDDCFMVFSSSCGHMAYSKLCSIHSISI